MSKMIRFRLVADIEFYASDLNLAWQHLAEHFDSLATGREPKLEFVGDIEVAPSDSTSFKWG